MGRYIVKRLLQIIPVLFIISFAVFLLVHVSGDPLATMLPPDADPAAVEEVRTALGLDKPVAEQYFIFVKNMLRGDFGTSYRYKQPAMQVVMERMPASVELAAWSLLFSIVVAIPLGILCARYRNSPLDLVFSGLSVVGQAMPSFWMGIMMILLFAVNLGWLPVSGREGWQNIIMPCATLTIVTSAQIIPLIRSSMLDIMHEDYIRTAKSKGLRERIVIYRHAFKNALIPVVTIMALQIPTLIGGALITETVFAWPGLGLLIVQAINGRDMTIVEACVFMIAFITIVANLLADLVYCLIDPRIRYQ